MPLEENSMKANTNSRKRTGYSLKKETFQMSNRHKRDANGITFKRGNNNLPEFYSGNADFAFDDDSFISSRYATQSDVKRNRNPTWTNNNIPQNFQNNESNKKTRDDFVITWPAEEVKEIDWATLFANGGFPNQNQNQNQNSVFNPSSLSNNQQSSNSNNVNNGSEAVQLCLSRCLRTLATNEYNPICGSDNVTYKNPSSYRCATNCGKRKLTFS